MHTQRFKTKPYEHQLRYLNERSNRKFDALLAEMGTGKSFIIINNIANLWSEREVDAAFILAPNGVHYNWTLQEIPKHMPDWVRMRVAHWSSNANKKEKAALQSLFESSDSTELRVLVMNSEAMAHKRSYEFAEKFCMSARRLMIAVDESDMFKSPSAARTKALMKLKALSSYRRIMTGTAITNSPFDAFSQFMFLDENILQTTSFYAFKAEYAEMMDERSHLVRKIVGNKVRIKPEEIAIIRSSMNSLLSVLGKNGRHELVIEAMTADEMFCADNYDAMAGQLERLRLMFNPGQNASKTFALQQIGNIERLLHSYLGRLSSAMAPGRLPQIVERDKQNLPKYKNLDKLNALIAPHSFRVMKKDCLDLPEKIHKTVYYDMTSQQQMVYDKVRDECRIVLNGEDTPVNRLVALTKLAQITSGYYLHPDAQEPVRIEGENPRLELLKERVLSAVQEHGKKVIVWARFRVQIDDIAKMLRKEGLSVVEYHGGVSKTGRLEALEEFCNGDASVFVGNQQAGGTGLTLIESSMVIYFSQDFSLRNRLQSEDRAHRIGQTEDVVYMDMIARGSVDQQIVDALINKKNVADIVLNI